MKVPMYTGVKSVRNAILYRQAEAEMIVLVNCPALPCRVSRSRVRSGIERSEIRLQKVRRQCSENLDLSYPKVYKK